MFQQVIRERTKHKASTASHPELNGGCFETLNLLHVSSYKMFTCCDWSYIKQNKNANKLSIVRSTDWKSSLNDHTLKFFTDPLSSLLFRLEFSLPALIGPVEVLLEQSQAHH